MWSPTPQRGDEACLHMLRLSRGLCSSSLCRGLQPAPLIKLQKQCSNWRLNPCHQRILTRDGLPGCSCVLRGVSSASHRQEGFSLTEDGYLHFPRWITLLTPLTAITKSPLPSVGDQTPKFRYLFSGSDSHSKFSWRPWGGLCGQSPIPLSYSLPHPGRQIQSTVSSTLSEVFQCRRGYQPALALQCVLNHSLSEQQDKS